MLSRCLALGRGGIVGRALLAPALTGHTRRGAVAVGLARQAHARRHLNAFEHGLGGGAAARARFWVGLHAGAVRVDQLAAILGAREWIATLVVGPIALAEGRHAGDHRLLARGAARRIDLKAAVGPLPVEHGHLVSPQLLGRVGGKDVQRGLVTGGGEQRVPGDGGRVGRIVVVVHQQAAPEGAVARSGEHRKVVAGLAGGFGEAVPCVFLEVTPGACTFAVGQRQ